jgi:Zn-finger nucleic acid-binding protein
MICPVCNSDMIVVEHNQIELDYCTDCHGVWFDSEELELLLKSLGLESSELLLHNLLQSPEADSTEKKRNCPICRQKMKKTVIGEKQGILIDVCSFEDGLWFDGGEVAHLLKSLVSKGPGEPGAQGKIIDFLGETFKIGD